MSHTINHSNTNSLFSEHHLAETDKAPFITVSLHSNTVKMSSHVNHSASLVTRQILITLLFTSLPARLTLLLSLLRIVTAVKIMLPSMLPPLTPSACSSSTSAADGNAASPQPSSALLLPLPFPACLPLILTFSCRTQPILLTDKKEEGGRGEEGEVGKEEERAPLPVAPFACTRVRMWKAAQRFPAL